MHKLIIPFLLLFSHSGADTTCCHDFHVQRPMAHIDGSQKIRLDRDWNCQLFFLP